MIKGLSSKKTMVGRINLLVLIITNQTTKLQIKTNIIVVFSLR